MLNDDEIKAFVERKRPDSWYDRMYHELRGAIFKTMLHGVRYDLDMAKVKQEEFYRCKDEVKREWLELTNTKIWAEKSHNSEELNAVLERKRELDAEYKSIPKEDRKARKAFKPRCVDAAGAIRACREAGRDKFIETGTGLSDDKIAKYFYVDMGVPAIRKKRKESGKITPCTDDIALKKVRMRRPDLAKQTLLIAQHRKCNTLLKYVDENKVSKDGRIRTMYKPFGTQSGRLASSEAPDGFGTNLQNFDRTLKTLLLPDKG